MFNDYRDDYRDSRDRVASGITDNEESGPGIYYGLAALLVICAVAAAFIFSGRSPHEQLANAPDRSHETTLPTPASPTIPSLPSATPGASPAAPSPAPQE